ncbi:MAG: nicotinate-nucleotide adenylyltransferase [Desulfobacteraceae bacterium]|jgi:nicotinate-nucleotide adenylyltransferase
MISLNQTGNPVQRIGLFGGTFNPIHIGHVRVAQDALQQFNFDQIHLIPCALPPHKIHGALAPAKDRVAMARLALKDQSAITVSTVETDRPGPSFTVDTLKTFKGVLDEKAALYFLTGVDAFLEIHTWKSYAKLFDLAAFVVMSRPTTDNSPLSLSPSFALNYIHRHISDSYALADQGQALVHPKKKTIYLAQVTPIAVASSQIRDRLRVGEPIHQWVDPAVSEYIDEKGLYR